MIVKINYQLIRSTFRLMVNLNDNANKEVMVHVNDDFNNQPVKMMVKPSRKIAESENVDDPKMIDQQRNSDNQINNNERKNTELNRSKQFELANDNDDNNSDNVNRFIDTNLENEEDQIMIDKKDKAMNFNKSRRRYENRRKNLQNSAYSFKDNEGKLILFNVIFY